MRLQQVLDSMRNTNHSKWPKAKLDDGSTKAKVAADGLEQDFKHLLAQAEELHIRCNDAITLLLSSVSISESKKAIEQAKRVGKLTFLAFIFVPLSFTTSFFGMNVKEFSKATSLWWWAVFTVTVFILTITLFFLNIARPFQAIYKYCKRRLLL
ncbi:uncharacterized protein BDZ99DRAFT_569903 [Mytilinidion resinicola]|uniref:Cora-domain-containing protein n=1 Tax=Mytilinidion resinicola TaxID=574789 RepID=A0A6A6YTR7_9PEZI|nr:uncharacterized protein BDZ99DRAFT_569903 [Mytilinidion resinicola]KAF2811968.1 hypothetical protein BDZ99DRAFT_569903 [Mytilinidion resinicola]